MALSTFLRNKVCSQGLLWSIGSKPLTVMPNVMLHLNAKQVNLKPYSTLIEKFDRSSTNGLRTFSTSESRYAGNFHPQLWKIERILSLALLGLIPSIFFVDSKELETVMAVFVSLHAYLGMDTILTDYVRSNGVKALAILVALIMLAGLLNIIHNDVGLAEVLRLFWKLDKEEGNKK